MVTEGAGQDELTREGGRGGKRPGSILREALVCEGLVQEECGGRVSRHPPETDERQETFPGVTQVVICVLESEGRQEAAEGTCFPSSFKGS